MQNLDMQTPDITSMNIENIAKLFPNVITEKEENGQIKKAIDFDLLKQELSKELVEDNEERYVLNWPGKKASLLKANTPINKTLRPCREDSVDFDKTENLYLEGDNFEVLKILQESYLGKVKMIYIDPPYNTGKDFVYRDKFAVLKSEYEEDLGVEDEEGGKLFKNTDTNGRFHSDWLSMMYERLTVARDLLKEDGVIFMSIDDNEITNLRKIADEIFGEENFLYQLTVINNLNGNDNSSGMMETHEYCLIYSRNIENFRMGVLQIDDEKELEKWSIDELGYWKEGGGLKATGINAPREKRPNLFFPLYINENTLDFSLEEKEGFENILLPMTDGKEMSWYWSKDKFNNDKNDVIIKKTNNSFSLYKKQRPSLGDLPSKRGKTSFYLPQYSNSHGTSIIKKTFDGEKLFDYSKSMRLIEDYIQLGNLSNDDIILDFFSGSATTAHAVMQLNAEDGGNRKFICVQLQEETDEKSEAFKAGYKNICEIGKERIRRAGKKIIEENEEKLKERKEKGIKDLDIGFRVYRTDSSNMKDVFYHPSEFTVEKLSSVISNIKEDRSSEDLLTQVILDLGLTLDMPIEKKEILGNTVYFVAGNSLVACFDENIDFGIVDEIAKIEPLRVVFRDNCFKTDSDRINFENKFKKLSGESDIRVI